jgi:hypothetical protein
MPPSPAITVGAPDGLALSDNPGLEMHGSLMDLELCRSWQDISMVSHSDEDVRLNLVAPYCISPGNPSDVEPLVSPGTETLLPGAAYSMHEVPLSNVSLFPSVGYVGHHPSQLSTPADLSAIGGEAFDPYGNDGGVSLLDDDLLACFSEYR